jgi:acetyl esterase/lipase
MATNENLRANAIFPLWTDGLDDDAFEFSTSEDDDDVAKVVVSKVTHPRLFAYHSTRPSRKTGKAILILAGGGYIELMVGKEGYKVALWLASLGFDAFVLIHRFPNEQTGAQAPLDDARQALRMIGQQGYGKEGLGVCGLSSGGHLGAALLSDYPSQWTERRIEDEKDVTPLPKIDFAIIGYGPISTNAKGRQIVADKKPLEPPEKQQLYDVVQPDVQLMSPAPPTFIVYSGNDPVVPAVNAYRLAEAMTKTGASVELHVFADAPHGFALDTVGLPVSKWPSMCEVWLEQGAHLA